MAHVLYPIFNRNIEIYIIKRTDRPEETIEKAQTKIQFYFL